MQVAPAASDPPVNVIDRLLDDVTRLLVPLQAEVVASSTLRPSGRISVKEMPVWATLPLAVLLMVNVNVDVDPSLMGSGANDLVMVGDGAGSRQPVRVTLSIAIRALLF